MTVQENLSPESYAKQAHLYFEQERYCEAIEYFNKSLELDSNQLIKHDIYYRLGRSYSNLESLPTAIKYLERALEEFETDKGFIQEWQIYLALAETLKEPSVLNTERTLGYFSTVIEILEVQSKKTKPWLPWQKRSIAAPEIADALLISHFNLGLYYLYSKNHEKAIYHFKQAIDTNGQNESVLANSCFFLGRAHLRNGNYKEAKKAYKVVLKLDANGQWVNIASLYSDLGQVHYYENDYPKSLSYLLKTFEIEQTDEELLTQTYLGLGYNYFALKQFTQAANSFRVYLKRSDPKAPERAAALEYLVKANELSHK